MPYQPRPPHGGENNKRSRWKKIITWLTLKIFSIQPLLVSAQVVADPNAGQNRPTVESAANGTTIVQITKPSAAGVSRNQYDQFSVDPQGVILNNATGVTQTQLAGYVDGNANLGGTSARVILNEVTSSNPSYLRGYTEVAGQKADVIIANPNGIFGDGFGFINISRATLTTGTPIFGGTGSLEAFRVTGGQISISGQGLNASNIDRVDLISRATTVNAGIWANQLNVVTGANQVDYATLATEKITGDGAQPQVSLDVSILGGMYANKIRLIGTEQGVGVNSQGVISATGGDLTVTQEGKIILTGSTTAGGQIDISTQDSFTNAGTLYAQEHTTINTAGALENTGLLAAGQNTTLIAQTIDSTGTLGAGLNSDGTLGSTGDLTVYAADTITLDGQTLAGGNLSMDATVLDLNNTTYAGGNATLTARSGDLDHTGGVMQINGTLNIQAQGAVNNQQGIMQTGQGLNINADTLNNQNGSLTNLGTGDLTIETTAGIDNTAGVIGGSGNLTIQAQQLTNQTGQVLAMGDLTLTTSRGITNTAVHWPPTKMLT